MNCHIGGGNGGTVMERAGLVFVVCEWVEECLGANGGMRLGVDVRFPSETIPDGNIHR